MMGTENRQYSYFFYYLPDLRLSVKKRSKLIKEMNELACECFEEPPCYQALSGQKSILDKCLIIVARDKDSKMKVFCSSLLIDVGSAKLLHFGLTCISPSARGDGLTHKLTSRLIVYILLRISLFKRIYISNLACVISSLVNVSTYFDGVYPSFENMDKPPLKYIEIAHILNIKYRNKLAINSDAIFDENTFVFLRSVNKQVFRKSSKDTRFFHRDVKKNDFYLDRLNFENGDEQLQVGKVGLLTLSRYLVR